MQLLTRSWWNLFESLPAALALTLAALISGALIGSERERRDKPAGLRTLIFVCLGATVFTMIGFTFSSTTADSGRVAAQIVTGIGFLGAGVILHSRGVVSGATTAATVWVTASIGMTIGAGYAPAGIALAVLARLVLVLVRAYELRFIDRVASIVVEVRFHPDHGKSRARLMRLLADAGVREKSYDWRTEDDQTSVLELRLRMARRPLRELIGSIAEVPAVIELQERAAAPES